jgi:hypothetical protein
MAQTCLFQVLGESVGSRQNRGNRNRASTARSAMAFALRWSSWNAGPAARSSSASHQRRAAWALDAFNAHQTMPAVRRLADVRPLSSQPRPAHAPREIGCVSETRNDERQNFRRPEYRLPLRCPVKDQRLKRRPYALNIGIMARSGSDEESSRRSRCSQVSRRR